MGWGLQVRQGVFINQKELFQITCSLKEDSKCAFKFQVSPPNLASDGAGKNLICEMKSIITYFFQSYPQSST